MIYDLSKQYDLKKFNTKVESFLKNKATVDMREIKEVRSLSQNAYLHVIISLFGIEFGYTLDESKTLLKRKCDFMRYEKNGTQFLKQTSKMDKEELKQFIDWIRNYAGVNGLYIPTSEEYLHNKRMVDDNIRLHREFL